jgi:hypothetical protein
MTWEVYLEPADTDEPRKHIGTIEGVSQGEALEKAAQLYEHPSYDLVVQKALTPSEENEQAVRCAVERAPQDLPYVEVLEADLYKQVETFGDRSEWRVQGRRWYVEVEVRNLNDATIAMVLYRVWRADTGEWKATWVPSV